MGRFVLIKLCSNFLSSIGVIEKVALFLGLIISSSASFKVAEALLTVALPSAAPSPSVGLIRCSTEVTELKCGKTLGFVERLTAKRASCSY